MLINMKENASHETTRFFSENIIHLVLCIIYTYAYYKTNMLNN